MCNTNTDQNQTRPTSDLNSSDVLDKIAGANGEIRLQPARYESGWYCIITKYLKDDEIWYLWDDLVGGDIEYFEAEPKLREEDGVILTCRPTPTDAMKEALSLI